MDYNKISEETIKKAHEKLALFIQCYNDSLIQFQVASMNHHTSMEHFNEIEERVKYYYQIIKFFIEK